MHRSQRAIASRLDQIAAVLDVPVEMLAENRPDRHERSLAEDILDAGRLLASLDGPTARSRCMAMLEHFVAVRLARVSGRSREVEHDG